MAITTFATLKTAINTWSSRSDGATVLNEAVAMCEGWIAHGLEVGGLRIEPLRIRAMETSADLTIDAQSESLPTRFLTKRRLDLSTDPLRVLDYYPPELFWETFAAATTGVPRAYTVEGDSIVFGPAPDGTYTGKMLYYQQPAPFSADGDANTILTSSPQIYLMGSLYALTRMIQSHPMATQWLADFAGSMNARNASDRKDRFGGAPLVSRVAHAP
jgi:hypothetical protein